MFRRGVDSLLGTLLVAALLPLIILPGLGAHFRPRWNAKLRRRATACVTSLSPEQVAGEFQFEHAVEAYEALIDSVLQDRRA